MDILRTELLDAIKHRNELNKWKILVSAIIGSTGLGFTGSIVVPYMELTLCAIPIICAYIDLIYYHDGLVINAIGTFIRTRPLNSDENRKELIEYEEFAAKARNLTSDNGSTYSAYDLVKIASFGSSIIFSVLIIVYSAIVWKETSIPILIFGILGILLTIWIRKQYLIRRQILNAISQT